MPASRSTQADLLKTVYEKGLRKQFSMKNILWQRFAHRTRVLKEGEQIHLKLHYGRTGGLGYTATNNLPVAREQLIKAGNWNYAKMMGRIEIDGHHVDSAAADYAAEARPYDLETSGMIKELRSACGFDVFADGTGILTTFPVQSSSEADHTAGVSTVEVTSTRGLYVGQVCDFLLISSGAYASTDGFVQGVITSINIATKIVTLTTATWDPAEFLDGDEALYGLYRSLSASESSYGNAFTGLAGIISASGTYGGINRATAGNEWFRGQLLDAGTDAAPTPYALQEAVDMIEKYSDGEANLIVTTHELWAHLAKILVDLKRYGGSQMKLNGWCQAIDFAGIPIVRDKFCPEGTAWVLDDSTFKVYENHGGKWMDDDGAILHRKADKYAYEAAWVHQFELICEKPNANVKVYDLKTAYPS